MRLDKYLKVSRLIKRRSIAKELCDKKRVTINNKTASASKEVKPEDIITIAFGNKRVTIKVKEIIASTKKDDSHLMYELLSQNKLKEQNDEIN